MTPHNQSLRTQFTFATVVVLATVAAVVIALYFHIRSALLDEREERLHEQVEIAAGVLGYYHAAETSGRLDRATAQAHAAARALARLDQPGPAELAQVAGRIDGLQQGVAHGDGGATGGGKAQTA